MPLRCKARTNSGRHCQAFVSANGLCALHSDPLRASRLGNLSGASRRRSGRKLKYSEDGVPKTIQEVATQIAVSFSDLRAGRIEPKLAGAIGYLGNVLLGAFEKGDVEKRLEALESALANSKSLGEL